jgi:cardiolipin synthase
VAEVAHAFADTWAATGPPLPEGGDAREPLQAAGEMDLRVVASTPGTAGLYRLDALVASLARRTLWLTDAYFAGTSGYVQALRAASQDGVDVRLLVPGPGSDIPLMQVVSRAGYRALLEAGIRVFEWNGPMLHAKTAVADARWARVGSTNLNLASWMGNRELDVVVENGAFGRDMEAMFLDDLGNATEIVLHRWEPQPEMRPIHARGARSGRKAL